MASKEEYELAAQQTFGGMSASGIDQLSGISDQVFGAVAKGAKNVAVAIGDIGVASYQVGSEFEAQMSTVLAVSQASAGEMKRLNTLAEQMGKNTMFSATEAGQGLEYLALSGWKAEEMMQGFPAILNLAAASGGDLSMVSEMMTGTLSGFGLQASDAARVADVLAQASSQSHTSVALLGKTFEQVAPVAGSFGFTVEDTTAALGLLADAGIDSERAGSVLCTLMNNLVSPSKESEAYMKRLGISMTDASGEMKSFHQIMLETRQGFGALTDAQQEEYAAGIAGADAMSGLLAIVNASDENFETLTDSIHNANGAAQKMSMQRLDNLTGDLLLLKGAAEGAGIGLYNGLSPLLRDLVQEATKMLNAFTESFGFHLPTIRRQLTEFGQNIKQGFAPFLELGEWFLENPEIMKSAITGIGAALLTFKGVKAAKDGVALLSTLGQGLSAWPVALAGVVIGGLAGLGTALKDLENQAIQKKLDEHFGSIRFSVEELEAAAKRTLGLGLFNDIDELNQASGTADAFYQSMKNTVNEINMANWKVSVGIELTEEEMQNYQAGIDSFMKNTQEYILAKGFELGISLKILGEDGENSTGEDSVYIELAGRVEKIFEDMHNELAANSGLPDEAKREIASKYMEDAAEIAQMVADAEQKAGLQVINDQFAGASMDAASFQNYQQVMSQFMEESNVGIEDAYKNKIASIELEYSMGKKGYGPEMTDQDYYDKLTKARQDSYQQKAEVALQGYRAMQDTIMQTYGPEIEPALMQIEEKINKNLGQLTNGEIALPEVWQQTVEAAVAESLESSTLSPDAQSAMESLVNGMRPMEEQMLDIRDQYLLADGQAENSVMLEMMEALKMTNKLAAISGSERAMNEVLGDRIAGDEALSLALLAAQKNGAIIPDEIIQSINEKQPEAVAAAETMLGAIRDVFGQGLNADVPINVNYKMTRSYLKTGNVSEGLEGHATGGIFDQPHIAWVAEGGYSEAIIPLDGSKRAMDLWQETGKLLGAYGDNNYNKIGQTITSAATSNQSTFSPSFAPTIHINGGQGTREEMMGGLQMAYEQFKEMLETYQREKFRAAF